MAERTRLIGLSLGADLCWPICYEEVLGRLDLALPLDGDTVRFAVERVSIEPFDLRQPCRYDLVVDRLTHWYGTSREWIKKAVLMDGLYGLLFTLGPANMAGGLFQSPIVKDPPGGGKEGSAVGGGGRVAQPGGGAGDCGQRRVRRSHRTNHGGLGTLGG